ncbi:MAG: hypothetical protein P4L73_02610 [Caulobacteraceae bacterium]|nr:hypothetical protein [Caulobacteraceae bacterium]
MTAVAYPIAVSAEAALVAPLGRAARQSQAAALAGEAVAFVTEAVGPAFASREAALDAYPGRLDDERPGRTAAVQPEDRFCQLRELAAQPPRRARAGQGMRPVYRDGRRWPEPLPPPQTVWRLSISYWRVGEAAQPVLAPPEPPARRGRAAAADPAALRRLAAEPLRPIKPQQPLDIGLFEFRPPEAPHIIMPDE